MSRYLIMMSVVFLLSVMVFYTVIFHLDPLGEQKNLAIVAFFASLFFLVTSFGTLLLFFATEIYSGHKLGTRQFSVSCRRGVWLGVLVVLSLLLQWWRLLGLVEFTLLVILLAILEWIFLLRR